ncbi:glycosyltransferase [bacterium]|nr:glycosyltransferase [bacterium]
MLDIFIGSLSTKKNNNGGERQKSSLMYRELLNICDSVVCINLERHRFFSVLKLIIVCLFRRKQINSIIISKFAKGGITIHKILFYLHFDFSKVSYFLVGSKLIDYINTKNYKYIKEDKMIVVESCSLKNELLRKYPNLKVEVLSNFKKIFDLDVGTKNYPQKQLRLVFFSRLLIEKGVLDLIHSLECLNSENTIFLLDIYGPESEDPKEKKTIRDAIARCESFCSYKGNLPMPSIDSYKILSLYDLHVFPTRFSEGIPGTIIDCFICGLPTLSSSFPRAEDLLDFDDSYFYKQFDNDDLIKKLDYIYNHQNELLAKREKTFRKRNSYSTDIFVDFVIKKGIIAS